MFVYLTYIKELHKHSSKELVYDSLVNIVLAPFIYFLFMLYMLFNFKAYNKFKEDN